jgi:hypothetical protein
MVAMILVRVERLREVLDVGVVLMLANQIVAELHHIPAFVQAKFAFGGHVAIGCRQNDL